MSKCDKAIVYLTPRTRKKRAEKGAPQAAANPVTHKLDCGLSVSYLLDSGDSFEYIDASDLDAEQVSPSDLHTNGVNNLINLLNADLQIQPHENIFGLFLDGNFEASLMLVPPLWDTMLRRYVEGDYLLAVPARDVIAFGDSDNPRAKHELRELIDKIWADGGHLISDKIYKYRDGAWKAFA